MPKFSSVEPEHLAKVLEDFPWEKVPDVRFFVLSYVDDDGKEKLVPLKREDRKEYKRSFQVLLFRDKVVKIKQEGGQ